MEPTTDSVFQRQRQPANHSAPTAGQSMVRQPTAPYLDHNQQDLLLAALNSQASGRQNTQANYNFDIITQESETNTQPAMNGASDDGLFMSPAQAHLDNIGNDFTPDLDYLDNDFDFENADLGGEMIGSLPGALDSNGAEQHEKRKNPDEDDDEEEGDAKRQEGEKGSKKPGRKPLTSEPTTKRKAQNRAAQRAFRERKEKHLKDLETKVTDLTKAHDADKHENGLLKAQIERLQIELREYRKRLSLNGSSGMNRSPPLAPSGNQRSGSNSLNASNNFQFEFPKFGALPGSQIFGNQGLSNGSSPNNTTRSSNTPPALSPTTNGTSFSSNAQQQFSRENSQARSMSPKNITGATTTGSPSQMPDYNPSSFNSFSTANNMHGFASTLPQMGTNPNDPFGDLFSPSILKSASIDSTGNYFQNNTQQLNGNNLNQFNDATGGDSTAGLNRVFQFNSTSSTSDSASPSASSASQWNANNNTSSCDTSPEPSHDSPATKVKDGETFCDKINPISNAQKPDQNQTFSNNTNTNFFDANYTMPSNDSFDPVLFGDYRESNDTGLGGGDFTGGFFDEALNPQGFDFGSPSNLFGILDSPQQQHNSLGVPSSGAANAPTPSKSLMAEVEKTCQGGDDDYGLPGSKSQQQQQKNVFTGDGNMISCNNIWNQLQSNPDFQEGKFDLDGLCSELRAKAHCSESGVMVDQDHVDAALRKLGKKDESTGREEKGSHSLMFEQQSWENVLKKLGGKGAL